jgi:hypothetical protein
MPQISLQLTQHVERLAIRARLARACEKENPLALALVSPTQERGAAA